MACCVALAVVLGFLRTTWARMLGRTPVDDAFPPAATWSSGWVVRTTPVVHHDAAGTPIGRALAATLLTYALLIHVLAATGLAHVAAAGIFGWVVRDVMLLAAAITLLLVGRRPTATAPALAGVGALWFALGVIDMHVFAGFEFAAVPLILDTAFHLSGWWLAIAAAGVTVVKRRQSALSIGVAA